MSVVQTCHVGGASVLSRRCKRVASAVQSCSISGASVSHRWCKRVMLAVQACRFCDASVSCRQCKRVGSVVQAWERSTACGNQSQHLFSAQTIKSPFCQANIYSRIVVCMRMIRRTMGTCKPCHHLRVVLSSVISILYSLIPFTYSQSITMYKVVRCCAYWFTRRNYTVGMRKSPCMHVECD